MNSGIEPLRAAIFRARRRRAATPPCAWPRAPKSPPGEPEMREVAPVSVPESCAITRSTGPPGANCTTTKRHQHDPEQGRDHEQDAADDVGGHCRSQCRRHARRRHSPSATSGQRLARTSLTATMLSRPLELRRLVAVVPPGFRDAAGIARLGRRAGRTRPNRRSSATPCTSAEPSSGRRGSRGRARGRRSTSAGRRLGGDDRVDQRVDRRIGDAGEVLRALDARPPARRNRCAASRRASSRS